MVLKDTAITRESYPFSFEIKLRCFLIPRQQEAKEKVILNYHPKR
ncbi:hypothetical protein [Candidatus Coxiella mudrowiae]|nr:hypothetical protein [Candidatus Coxiella mudrowiae]